MKAVFAALLLLGLACLVLDIWSLMEGELRNAVLGIFLAACILYNAHSRWLRLKRGL